MPALSPNEIARPIRPGPVRNETLDALRGLALCGILLVNVPSIAGMTPTAGPWRGAADQWLDVLVQERFFPLFSFLFGMSAALFLDRAVERTGHPRLVLLRRLLVLGVIGAAHQLLQPGEALLPYALAGLVVLLPATWLPRPVILLGGLAGIATPLVLGIGGLGLVPGLFLLGLASARYGLPAALDRPVRWQWVLVLLGATAAAGPLLALQVNDVANSGFDRISAIAGLALAVAYCAGLVLLLHSRFGAALSGVLAPLGRLALTNYLAATLVVVAASGPLGLSGGDGYGVALALATAILVGQILAGRWWTARFRYGPAEWAWRTVTWWSPAPMRRLDRNMVR